MAPVPVPHGRATIEDDGLSLRVSLPPRRSAFVIVFLGAWLGGWFLVAMFAIRELTTSAGAPDAFLMFWLAVWTVVGAAALLRFLWMLLGREIIELRPDAIVYRRAIVGIGRTKVYDLAHVKDLRLGHHGAQLRLDSLFDRTTDRPDLSRVADALSLTGGSIVFDYGPRTISCGASLDEAEAKVIIEAMRRRSPRLRTEGSA